MAEIQTSNMQVQSGLETTPGTAVAALKRFASLDITLGIQGSAAPFVPAGQRFGSVFVPGRNWTQGKLSGRATYGELPYPLASVLKNITPAADGAAYLWDWVPSLASPETGATYTVDKGSYVRAQRVPYLFVSELGLKFSRDNGVEYDGSVIGANLTDGVAMSGNATYTLTAAATPPTAGNYTLTVSAQTTGNIAWNATPAQVQTALEALSSVGAGNALVALTAGGPTTAVANTVYTVQFVNGKGGQAITLTGTFTGLTATGSIALAAGQTGATVTNVETTPAPVAGDDIDVYIADTWAGLDAASALTRIPTAEWHFGPRWQPWWGLNSSYASFATQVETPQPKCTLKMTLAADSVGMQFYNCLTTGTRKFVRIKCTGPTVAVGKTGLLQIDGCYGVGDKPDEFKDEQGLYAIGWTLTASYDAVAGKAVEVQVRNALSAL
jgi:hypothetical protein